MHLLKKAQIAYLKVDEAFTKISNKYANFADIFLPKLAVELFKYMRINNYAIKLVDNWQLPYGLIYSLSLVKLEILKMHIKNNLANNFIRPSKVFAGTFISFDKKSNQSL